MLTKLSDHTILRERYKITNVIGQGGMGSIYQAADLRLPGRWCAIKEVQFDPYVPEKTRQQLQRQFLQEASILAQLDHPNLPKVSDYFSEEGKDYLVMDFVPGKDLRQILEASLQEGELLDEELVMAWALQIIDALSYLHQQKPPVLHRDIKPANIKLTPDNRIKLVDFGLVKVMVQDEVQTITVVQGRGTALYTPLEQYGGESDHTDVRSDIYALGATLYHLLTGQKPLSAKARFLRPTALKKLNVLNPRLPQSVNSAVLWAMDMHPEERPNDVLTFREALLGESPTPVKERLPSTYIAPWIEAMVAHKMPAFLALGLLLLALFVTFTF